MLNICYFNIKDKFEKSIKIFKFSKIFTKIFGIVRSIVLLCTILPKAQDCSRVDPGPQAEGMNTL